MKEPAQNGTAITDDVIVAGRTVVLQKYKYLRTHLLNPNKNLQLGRDVVNLGGIVGHPYGTTFQMVSDHKNNKCFKLEVPVEVISLEDLFMNGDGGKLSSKLPQFPVKFKLRISNSLKEWDYKINETSFKNAEHENQYCNRRSKHTICTPLLLHLPLCVDNTILDSLQVGLAHTRMTEYVACLINIVDFAPLPSVIMHMQNNN